VRLLGCLPDSKATMKTNDEQYADCIEQIRKVKRKLQRIHGGAAGAPSHIADARAQLSKAIGSIELQIITNTECAHIDQRMLINVR